MTLLVVASEVMEISLLGLSRMVPAAPLVTSPLGPTAASTAAAVVSISSICCWSCSIIWDWRSAEPPAPPRPVGRKLVRRRLSSILRMALRACSTS